MGEKEIVRIFQNHKNVLKYYKPISKIVKMIYTSSLS